MEWLEPPFNTARNIAGASAADWCKSNSEVGLHRFIAGSALPQSDGFHRFIAGSTVSQSDSLHRFIAGSTVSQSDSLHRFIAGSTVSQSDDLHRFIAGSTVSQSDREWDNHNSVGNSGSTKALFNKKLCFDGHTVCDIVNERTFDGRCCSR